MRFEFVNQFLFILGKPLEVMMLSAPSLKHEELRLQAVAEYDPQGPFDDSPYTPILDMARDLFDVPTAFVSILDRHEQIFAARRGLSLCRTDREVSFCDHAIAQDDILVVPDATLDPRFHDNPLVTGGPEIRFYAGLPLRSATGQAISSLCVADVKPHLRFSNANAVSCVSWLPWWSSGWKSVACSW